MAGATRKLGTVTVRRIAVVEGAEIEIADTNKWVGSSTGLRIITLGKLNAHSRDGALELDEYITGCVSGACGPITFGSVTGHFRYSADGDGCGVGHGVTAIIRPVNKGLILESARNRIHIQQRKIQIVYRYREGKSDTVANGLCILSIGI
ncbi:MAG: hypothetical protein P9F19_01610 [Candidatus Contendobacter sp.]|nr:hypothetical protein [Candidatus Contendobacter sp.]MDG4556086.1 hypothetical protein [Candidatus Contendobacter sp.]